MAVIEFPTIKGTILVDDEDAHLLVEPKITSHGYVRVGDEYLHRLIIKPSKHERIDHRNSNKLDNRRENLRLASISENGRNRGRAKHNKSGFKGVYLCSCTNRWRAEIRVNGKVIKIGRFDHPEDAARAYDEAAIKYHGEFAFLNFSERSDVE